MRVICLYRPDSETERSVLELNRELQKRYSAGLELVSMNTKDGSNLAQVYDVWQFPSILALDDAGVLQKSWTEGNLPLINELSYYLT